MNYKLIIGLETHIRINTEKKLFSSQINSSSQEPNSCFDLIEIGYPGILPVLNYKVIEKAIAMANHLNTKISDLIVFDRKNYFFPDSPKGYQITQSTNPIGKDGFVCLSSGIIRINHIHIEEDAAKINLDKDKNIYLDYNRCGSPLIEIVTEPDFSCFEQVTEYLKFIWRLSKYIGISNGIMEQGHFKCDVNISLLFDSGMSTNRVEIKNLNSFNFIQKAIEYEKDRALASPNLIQRETRGFCDKTNSTYSMRKKEFAYDYRYSLEYNIPPIRITEAFKNDIVNKYPFPNILNFSMLQELSKTEIDFLLDKSNFTHYYLLLCRYFTQKVSYNWSCIYMNTIKGIENIDYNSLLSAVSIGLKIGNKSCIEYLEKFLLENNKQNTFLDYINNILSKTKSIDYKQIIQDIIKDNMDVYIKSKQGNQRALGFLIGQAIKKYKDQLNPAIFRNHLINFIHKDEETAL